ncbi:MAG: tripartite tricarboxylate transporter substrate binding protein, partial [Rubrivivax sp.]|nr:tripartite tricarboxylate transporter substrate binding protein [Rubrivivax sp.]
MNPSKRNLIAALVAALATWSAASAFAQDWPTKPVRLIVNFPPGGAADVIGRSVAQSMSEALGQQVVVENRPGANGNLGA